MSREIKKGGFMYRLPKTQEKGKPKIDEPSGKGILNVNRYEGEKNGKGGGTGSFNVLKGKKRWGQGVKGKKGIKMLAGEEGRWTEHSST